MIHSHDPGPADIIAAFSCDGVGFKVRSTVHAVTGEPVHLVHIHGKRDGEKREAQVPVETLSAELWALLGRLISS